MPQIEVPQDFLTGVIEGFYGRAWSHGDRLNYAAYQRDLGFNAHLYCPKSDPCLRKQWQQNWPTETAEELTQLAHTYHGMGQAWGVGLSPFALYQNYDQRARDVLRAKIEHINALGGSLLGILFDDMPGDIADLAQRQCEIVADVCSWTDAKRILVCPTYYSLDPVLEKYFGQMPEHYWARLGENLPQQVDVFWTGPKVCSERITAEHLAGIRASLDRPLVLWDNYPVNDGGLRSKHLYLDPLPGREPEAIADLRGHFCNPMNQALLSLPALLGLAGLYRSLPVGKEWLEQHLTTATWQALQTHTEEFRESGLGGMGPHRCAELAEQYGQLAGAAAAEVAAWLRGEYTFDPACLTD
jgi:hyaluronoglucosaminidase